jgi:hypothetical protein
MDACEKTQRAEKTIFSQSPQRKSKALRKRGFSLRAQANSVSGREMLFELLAR